MNRLFHHVFFVVPALLLGLWTGSAMAEGTLKVGVLDDSPPMVFRNAEAEIVGYDVDVLQEIGRRIGKSMQFMVIPWDEKTEYLNSGKIDVIAGALMVTEERKGLYALTAPVVKKFTEAAIVADSAPMKTTNDLSGKTVCTMAGSSSNATVAGFRGPGGPVAKQSQAPTLEACLVQVAAGEVESAVMDGVTCAYYVKHNPGQFRILSGELSDGQTAFGLRKHETQLTAEFNRALAGMETDGTMKTLGERWFGGHE